MADKGSMEPDSGGAAEGLVRKAAGLVLAVVLVVLVAGFVVLRLLPRLVKLFILAVIVGVIVYFVRVGRGDPTDSGDGSPKT